MALGDKRDFLVRGAAEYKKGRVYVRVPYNSFCSEITERVFTAYLLDILVIYCNFQTVNSIDVMTLLSKSSDVDL